MPPRFSCSRSATLHRSAFAVLALATLWTASAARAQLNQADFPPPAIQLTSDPAASSRPKVSIDADGNAVVVWQDTRYGNSEILWQKFSLLGDPLSGLVRVTQTATSSVWPDVSCGDKLSHIVWQEGSDLDNGQVYLGRRDAYGIAPKLTIATPTYSKHPRVAALAGEDADVVWYQRKTFEQDVFYRRYHIDGTYDCERRFNAGTSPDYQKDPVVAVGGDASATLLWYDMGTWFDDQLRQATVSFTCAGGMSAFGFSTPRPAIDIAGTRTERILQAGGQIHRLTPANQTCQISATTGSASYPSVATTASTSYAVWQDTRDGNNNIYLCQYADCSKLTADLPLTLSPGSSELPDIAVNRANGDWVAVWQDNVSGNTEIYMTSSQLLSRPRSYTIAGATFNKQLYLNGTDVATISVVAQSFAGASADLSLHTSVFTNLQDTYDLGVDSFTLAPGGSHASTFSLPIPARNLGCDLGLRLELMNGAAVVASVEIPHAASATYMTQTEIDQKIAELTTNECAPPVTDCQMYMIGMIPGFGLAADFVSFKSAVCEAARKLRLGENSGAALGMFEATLPFLDSALEGLPAAAAVSLAVVQEVRGLWACATDLFGTNSISRGTLAAAGSPPIDSLAASVGSAFVEHGRPFTNELFTQGPVTLRVGALGHWSSADSMSITETYVFPALDAGTRWAHVGPEPIPVGTAEVNPPSAIDVEIVASAADSAEFGFLHRVGSSPAQWIRYPRFPILAGTVGRLSVSDSTVDFRLYLDHDGDGDPEQVCYPLPEGRIVDVPPDTRRLVAGVRLLAGRPNPLMRSTRIQFELPATGAIDLGVFDTGGRRVATLVNEVRPAGTHAVTWKARGSGGSELKSGVYFVRLTTPWGMKTGKLVLL